LNKLSSDDQMMQLIHVPGSQTLFMYSMGMFVPLTVKWQLKQHR